MQKIILFLTIVLLFISCNDKEMKYKLIEMFVKEPRETMEAILQDTTLTTTSCRYEYERKEKKEHDIQWLYDYFQEGYVVIDDFDYILGPISIGEKSIEYDCNRIVIESKKNGYATIFGFMYEHDKWRLNGIITTSNYKKYRSGGYNDVD